ncbi:MAG: hypothetical protein P1T08_02175 [Acidimicrobiia bacterium]|nr:hypothetical protein [Acidimicrobiia bacterium]
MVLADLGRRGFVSGHMDGFGYWYLVPILVVLAVIVTLGVVLFNQRGRFATEDPLRRVAGRYAAGKIERVEFERVQRDLLAMEAGRLPGNEHEGDGGDSPAS